MANEENVETAQDANLIQLTAGVVQSYLNNNQMQPDQVPHLMQQVHDKFAQLQQGHTEVGVSGDAAGTPHEPPVKPKNSVRKNEVVCLECGKTFKTLKRHLRIEHGLEESDYKARWDLPKTFKLVAKSYSEQRSNMAKQIGLGAGATSKGRGLKKG